MWRRSAFLGVASILAAGLGFSVVVAEPPAGELGEPAPPSTAGAEEESIDHPTEPEDREDREVSALAPAYLDSVDRGIVDAASDGLPADVGYDDEPPLDYSQRQWRRYTREVRPQRFSDRDLRRRYGYDAPFTGFGYRGGYGFGYGPWGTGVGPAIGLPSVDPAAAYVQGRHDERRFREWKTRHDKGRAAYVAAMTDGVRLFRETDYAGSVGHFVRASRLNEGDPASRLHAAYALVAIGNYAAAAPLLVRAIELQPQLPYLPLSIREEYGPQVDFDAHWQRLRVAANTAENDAELWFVVAFYGHFTKDRATAQTAIDNVRICAPADYDDYALEQLAEAARMLTPSVTTNVAVPPTDPAASK